MTCRPELACAGIRIYMNIPRAQNLRTFLANLYHHEVRNVQTGPECEALQLEPYGPLQPRLDLNRIVSFITRICAAQQSAGADE